MNLSVAKTTMKQGIATNANITVAKFQRTKCNQHSRQYQKAGSAGQILADKRFTTYRP